MVCITEGMADPTTLKNVGKSVVQEEDRIRNVLIFGLPEEKNENVEGWVQEILEEIGHCTETSTASYTLVPVYQILSQVRKLRQSAKFSKVFVRPDRSAEERAINRLLVQELVQRRENTPEKLHFIKAGTIHSAAITLLHINHGCRVCITICT